MLSESGRRDGWRARTTAVRYVPCVDGWRCPQSLLMLHSQGDPLDVCSLAADGPSHGEG